jgi:phenylalanyl-tRNA synthetase beta chain
MKISYDWLKDFIDLPLSPSELVDLLNHLGLMVEEIEEKEGEVILEIETYANRPDTLGHLGIAREVAAALRIQLKEKPWPVKEIPVLTSGLIGVEIFDPDLCPRYCGVVVREVKVGPSPAWLKRRLEAVGLRSINNVVDVTNYVLMATGQPIHAFDLSRLAGPRIIVRRGRKGEKLRILGGVIVDLPPESLVIADAEKPVALAGIIGGEESAVTETTSEVFIESACFNPVSVRQTRQRLGLDTDAAYRFERGSDISYPPVAARLAASLLTEFGGQMTQGIIDIYPQPYRPKEILLRLNRVEELLGVKIERDFISSLLPFLGFETQSWNESSFLVRVPSHRVDIEREADLIEEVARFYGYDRIPAILPPLKVLERPPERWREQVEKLRQTLFHQGFDEVLNFSFSDPEKEKAFNTGFQPISLSNPLSQRYSLLRTTLLGGLLENIAYNQKRGAAGVNIFELGNIYYYDNSSPTEKFYLALAANGWVDEPGWAGQGEKADFFYLKGTCELLLRELRYEPFSFRLTEHAFFESQSCLSLEVKGDVVGYLGRVKPELLALFEVEGEVLAAEINLSLLLSKQPRPFVYVPVARFPAIIRDLSFVVPDEIPYETIRQSIDSLNLPHLESFALIDRFASPKLGENVVSMTLRFIYRHPHRTLLAEEADRLDSRVISHLRSAFQAKLREGGAN